MGEQKRIRYIDIYRGVGIILMVTGHVGIWGTFGYWIHAFHMPMFFFIAGYLYREHSNYREYLVSKARSLLIPYACYGLLAYVIYLSLHLGDAVSPLVHMVTDNTTGVAHNGAIWFLTALFWVYVIYMMIEALPLSMAIRTAIYYTIAVMGCLEVQIMPAILPLALGPAFVGVGLYHTARLIRDSQGPIHRLLEVSSVRTLCIWTIVDTVLILISPEINMRTRTYPNFFMFWVNAVSSSLLLINLCREYCNRAKSCRILDKISDEISYIGNHSIVYVCLNLPILFLLGYVWDITGYGLAIRSVIRISRVLIALSIMRLWSELTDRTWLRATIGK